MIATHFFRKLLPVFFTATILVAACSRPPNVIGVADPERSPEMETQVSRHDIFIATTRSPSLDTAELFSSERSDKLGLAVVTVTIPPNHQPGEITRPRRLPPDASRDFTVVDPIVFQDSSGFVAKINNALSERPRENRDVLVFVHGYNNTLSDAVLRVAQFVEDSGFEGVPVLFSWASAGQVAKYAYDLNSVLAARPLLEEASGLIVQTNASGFDVFAHSMGTLLVTEVMVQSDLQGSLGSSGRLRNILFAAPDIDVDVFASQLSQITNNPGNLYVLISDGDPALGLSRQVAGGIDRVGDAEVDELAGLGITVIDLSDIDDSRTGSHSKFAGSPEVVQLVGRTLQQHGYSEKRTDTIVLDALQLIPNTVENLSN